METIQLSITQREQMAGLITHLSTSRQIAEAFVGYFAKELGINLQLYQFNADILAFEPVQAFAPPQNFPEQVQETSYRENGRIEAM